MTGIPEPTLRAWERRYGIPSPERTEAGYRLYGAKEIAEVERMRELCDGGMAASEAAKVVRFGTAPAAKPPGVESGFAESRRALVSAIERFDDAELEAQVKTLYFIGNPSEVLEQVVEPVLRAVGEKWHAGELSVAQEHLASQRIGTLLRDLARLSAVPTSRGRVVIGSFADDEHELGLHGLAILLSSWGFGVVNLGARTPPSAVENAVEMLEPALVGLSLTIAPTRSRAKELCRGYAKAARTVPWIVGGGGVGAVRDEIVEAGGIVAPENVVNLRALVDQALTSKKKKSARRSRN